jgi:hypothetical protein
MSNFKKGDQVRQILPAPIVGNVAGFHADQETGALQVCVEFQDAGETRTRYFDATQIEAVPAE